MPIHSHIEQQAVFGVSNTQLVQLMRIIGTDMDETTLIDYNDHLPCVGGHHISLSVTRKQKVFPLNVRPLFDEDFEVVITMTAFPKDSDFKEFTKIDALVTETKTSIYYYKNRCDVIIHRMWLAIAEEIFVKKMAEFDPSCPF